MKPLKFLGDSLDQLRGFPLAAQSIAGFQLDCIQRGIEPDDWKPMKIIGPGVREIRVREASGAFRVIYLATLPNAVYVLHAFRKKTQKTEKQDIDLAAARLRDLMRG
ncbi:type II toxin-antitoxin system RelE/ParE family toxin [Pseudomonas cichorii]|uniref:Type II toxin-antitoxin system RelE/ParE family toxin n=2 Tax=Pseudomonas lijiangensis TaxID=2995658 RepID=A0ABX8I0P0_9PSED|nr:MULTISPECIES: type II toxin-antitoxin system RelE/ParE family toxin [Pseudomonas syringae group]MBX8500842.1 type II toxin-antitoxin system RelE/ParE family toxin [Pseudomonas lijiangensis]MBX8505849.1 type II toxin-antitoxin system RelE/ParE family toxin [Pseudomonas lijiangensis]MBX8520278.1 type II toxin-antitoxin system RelE/ParE family toxin [Pseudomonas cichorii]MBX8544389.1 type II toxin-antitoxin system RelE/ParE family toxin [Pseudomonas cichorii]MBX8549588.1 type II toxin-antitoxi